MSVTDTISAELFQDKSLLAVYRHSASYAENWADKCIKIVSALVLITFAVYIAMSSGDYYPAAIKSISSWTAIGFNYSITILGFLVAGFTIFATMTKVEIFIALALARHKTAKVSHIKFIFYSFLRVFINHMALLFACVSVTMLRDSSSIFLGISSLDPASIISIKKFGVIIVFPVLGYLLINAMLQLKTFVWNLYQSIIVAIAGAVTIHELSQKN